MIIKTLFSASLVAANSAEPTATACNELSLDSEWLRITPYGDFPNKVGLQRVRREDAQEMVDAFNSVRGKVARLFLGVPIFAGHPDMDPDHYEDRRRHGKVTELEAREDGLYGKVALNDLGKTAIDQGHYLYCSPVWNLKRDGKFVRPKTLLSVGLTNTPNIPGDPWAKNTKERTDMLQWLVGLLSGLGRVKPEATEEEAKTAVNELAKLPARVTELEGQLKAANDAKKAIETDRDTLKAANTVLTTERDGLKASNAKLSTARVERELEIAVNSGLIKVADKVAWNSKLTADLDKGLAELQAQKPAVNTKSAVSGLGGRKEAETTAGGEKITAINEAVRKYATENNLNIALNDGYNAAFAAVRRAQPGLFS